MHLLVRINIPSKFEGNSPKHCQVIKLFSTKGPGDFDLCPEWGTTSLLSLIISIAELQCISFFGPRAIIWTILVEVHLNNLGRGLLGGAMYQISKAWAFCFQTRRFLKFFPILVYLKQVTPITGPFLTLGIKSERLWLRMKLHTKYQRPGPSGFREEDFFKFSAKKSIFSCFNLDMQWTRTIWTTLKEDQPRFWSPVGRPSNWTSEADTWYQYTDEIFSTHRSILLVHGDNSI